MGAIDAERLAAAARAQTDLPDGRVVNARRAWEERMDDVWGVTVEGRDRTSNAFFHVSDGRIAVPAGPAQAARELRAIGALDGQPWGGGLIYVVVAAGGATAGFPDVWSAAELPLAGGGGGGGGGARIVVSVPEQWVAYAVAGGVGPAPTTSAVLQRGLAAPPTMATATLDIGADYALRWRYQLGDRELDGPAAAPAPAPPALSDAELVAALDGARLRAAAPRAMPAREPALMEGQPDVVVVDLWALGPVYVYRGEANESVAARLAALGVDWSAAPAQLVPLLSAAGALAPGMVPADLAAAVARDGELTAQLPAPLVEWFAGDARQRSPRVAGVKLDAEMARRGRVRLPLDGSLGWALEVDADAIWHPAVGGGP